METLPFFGVSVEYSCAFSVYFVNLRSFHFGVTMEFSRCCAVYCNRGINDNSILSVEKVRIFVCKRL